MRLARCTHYIKFVANGEKKGQLGSGIVRLPRASEAETEDIESRESAILAHSIAYRFYKNEGRIKMV